MIRKKNEVHLSRVLTYHKIYPGNGWPLILVYLRKQYLFFGGISLWHRSLFSYAFAKPFFPEHRMYSLKKWWMWWCDIFTSNDFLNDRDDFISHTLVKKRSSSLYFIIYCFLSSIVFSVITKANSLKEPVNFKNTFLWRTREMLNEFL